MSYKVIITDDNRMSDGVTIGYNNLSEIGLKELKLSTPVAKNAALAFLKLERKKINKEKNNYEYNIFDEVISLIEKR